MENDKKIIIETKESENVSTQIHNFFSDFPQFSEFLNENGLSIDTYLSSLKSYMLNGRRYFRTSLNKSFEKSEIVKMILETNKESETEEMLKEDDIDQLPGEFLSDIYSLPLNTKINN